MVDDNKPAAERGEHPPSLGEASLQKIVEAGIDKYVLNPKHICLPPDPTRWTPEREMMKTLDKLQDSDQRARVTIAGFIGAIIGFILGYFTFAVWPSWGLIVKMFNECYFGG